MRIELLLHSGVGGASGELCPQLIGLQQVATPTVGNYVGDRFAAYGEGYPLTGPYGINDTSGPIAEVTHSDLHVRQRSTGNRYGRPELVPGCAVGGDKRPTNLPTRADAYLAGGTVGSDGKVPTCLKRRTRTGSKRHSLRPAVDATACWWQGSRRCWW